MKSPPENYSRRADTFGLSTSLIVATALTPDNYNSGDFKGGDYARQAIGITC